MPITRRDMLRAAAASCALPLQAASRPNVLFIIADDLNTDVACYGLPEVKTPHIDRLAARGVRFDRAYCQYPLCNPSRSSFLSGLRPETTRVFDQKTVLREKRPATVMLPDLFRTHGYFAAAAGKAFHHNKPNLASWDEFQGFESKSPHELAAIKRRYAHPEGDRTPDWAVCDDREESTGDAISAAKAIGWMERAHTEKKPFFVVAGFVKPHLPWAVPRKYFDMYPEFRVREEPAMRSVPPVALITELGASRPPQPRWQAIAAYRAATSFMDAQVGKLTAAMDRFDLWQSTIVVMIGDNGFHLGDHGIWSKNTLFERTTRVPLAIAAPGVKAGQSCSRTTELLDVYPTLADLAGVPAPAALEGRSLRPLLREPQAAWDRPARSVVQRDGFLGRTVRTGRWRYTEWDDGKQGAELYDHERDPGEYINLAQHPQSADTVRKLRAILRPAQRS